MAGRGKQRVDQMETAVCESSAACQYNEPSSRPAKEGRAAQWDHIPSIDPGADPLQYQLLFDVQGEH